MRLPFARGLTIALISFALTLASCAPGGQGNVRSALPSAELLDIEGPAARALLAQNKTSLDSTLSKPLLSPDRIVLGGALGGDHLAWIEQRDAVCDVRLRRLGDTGIGRVVASLPFPSSYLTVSLNRSGSKMLLLSQTPEIHRRRERAWLDLLDLKTGHSTRVSTRASVHFRPDWCSENTFLYAEADESRVTVYIRTKDGPPQAQFHHAGTYPRLLLQKLWPEGWVVIDRNDITKMHVWMSTQASPGGRWKEVRADQRARPLGWRNGKLILAVRDSRETGHFVFLELSPTKLQAGTLDLGSGTFRPGPAVENAVLLGARLFYLEVASMGHRLMCLDLDNDRSQVLSVGSGPLHGQSLFSQSGDAGKADQALLLAEGLLQPPTLYRLSASRASADPLIETKIAAFPVDDIKVAMDATTISFTPRRPPGPNPKPALLEAYGAFGSSVPPTFDPVRVRWLQRGGRVVLARLAGHLKDHERTAQELLSLARSLSPGPVAFRGVSFGGTLGLISAERSSDVLSAVWADSALSDLLEFTRFPPAEMWVAEFGDPKHPKDQERLRALSPLHNIETRMPPLLLSTSLSDEIVHPSHTLRMFAQMKILSPLTPCFLLVETRSLHEAGGPRLSEQVAAVDLLWRLATRPEQGKRP